MILICSLFTCPQSHFVFVPQQSSVFHFARLNWPSLFSYLLQDGLFLPVIFLLVCPSLQFEILSWTSVFNFAQQNLDKDSVGSGIVALAHPHLNKKNLTCWTEKNYFPPCYTMFDGLSQERWLCSHSGWWDPVLYQRFLLVSTKPCI